MPGIHSREDLQFDLFDALGLDPTSGPIIVTAIHKAWRRVNLQIHPDKLVTAAYVPAFPTYDQAQKARDYLLAEDSGARRTGDSGASQIYARIRTALSSGKVGYRSTWNPWAPPKTEDVLKPMPGAPTVETHGPAPTGPDPQASSARRQAEGNQGGWTEQRRERWWTEPEDGSHVPDLEGRKQWEGEELRRKEQAERDRCARIERREMRKERREMRKMRKQAAKAMRDEDGGMNKFLKR
ncbi:hypothetical protein MMC11_001315 [Xylographa trunciseda]|nr:hypothetical protein [Xylographa trunciseda]